MAIAIHAVTIKLTHINAVGAVVDKETATTGEMATASHEPRVLPDADVPNSALAPTIHDYLILEAASDFVVKYMDQYNIITYDQGDANSAA